MKASFNHFVITRFNLKQIIWKKDKQGRNLNTGKWLKERYELFEKFCYPSLKNQTEQNFKWLVYFDVDTPQVFKSINQGLHRNFSNFIPIYVSDFTAFEQDLSLRLKEYIDIDKAYLITTRLDNDDCFHKDAIKIIQQNFKAEDKTVIDLCKGLTLQVEHEYKLSVRDDVYSGSFISLIEKVQLSNDFLTVYDREHLHWVGDANYIRIDGGYYWLQIIHNRNISNQLNNNLTFNKSYLKGYDFIEKIHFTPRYYLFVILKKMNFIRVLKSIKKRNVM